MLEREGGNPRRFIRGIFSLLCLFCSSSSKEKFKKFSWDSWDTDLRFSKIFLQLWQSERLGNMNFRVMYIQNTVSELFQKVALAGLFSVIDLASIHPSRYLPSIICYSSIIYPSFIYSLSVISISSVISLGYIISQVKTSSEGWPPSSGSVPCDSRDGSVLVWR